MTQTQADHTAAELRAMLHAAEDLAGRVPEKFHTAPWKVAQ
jgi:hypothetical protein